MHIKSFKTKQFAGVKNKEVEFKEGLNLVLGPNESGKSTLVEAIYATLFKDIKLRDSVKEDKDFKYRFFPKPIGDFIEGRLNISFEKEDYELYKAWGQGADSSLELPNGTLIKSSDEINKKMSLLLPLSTNTYNSIVFAKQRDIKSALANILEDSQVKGEIKDILTMAFMELGGVSLDDLGKKIEADLDNLYKRWDKSKSGPEANRGISNPYKTGLGTILEGYYKKEGLKLAMDNAKSSEEAFERVISRLSKSSEEFTQVEEKRKALETIEEDVNKRQVIDLRLENNKKESDELSKVVMNWPVNEYKEKEIKGKIEALKKEKEALVKEKANIELMDKIFKLKEDIKRIKEIEDAIKRKDLELENLPKVTKEDHDELLALERKIHGLRLTLSSGKLKGEIQVFTNKPLSLQRDLGQIEVVDKSLVIQPSSHINIEYENELKISLTAGDIDYEAISKELKTEEIKLKEKLESLKVSDTASAKINLEEREIITKEKDKLLWQKNKEEEKETKEIKEEKINSLGDLKVTMSLADLAKKEGELDETLRSLEIEAATLKKTLSEYLDNYESQDKIMDKLINIKSQVKNLEEEKVKLAKLPDDFESPQAFKDKLNELRTRSNELKDELSNLKVEQSQAQNALPDESYEEYTGQYLLASQEFENLLNYGKKLELIEKAFYETKSEMAKNPMEPLQEDFLALLSLITDRRYKEGVIDTDLSVNLEAGNGKLPLDLLSAGTYDSVVLALRLSIFKHISKDQKGFMILDDCLVDLDPKRKKEAISLIQEFAKDHQVIFTTCDPQTAESLGGNLIELE